MKKIIKEQAQQINSVVAPKDEIQKLQIDLLKDKGVLLNLSYSPETGQPQQVVVGGKPYTAGIKTSKGNFIVYDGRVLTNKNGKWEYLLTPDGKIGLVPGMTDSNLTDAFKGKLESFGLENVSDLYGKLNQHLPILQGLINKGAVGDMFRDFNDLLKYYYSTDQTKRLTPKSENEPYVLNVDKDTLESKYKPESLDRYGLKGTIYLPRTAGASLVTSKLTAKEYDCFNTLSNYFVTALQTKATGEEILNTNQIKLAKDQIKKCKGLGAYDRGKFQGFTEKNVPVEVTKKLKPYGFLNRKLNFSEIIKKLEDIPEYSLTELQTESIKNVSKILRENLIKVKENKKNLIVEESIIKNRFSVIVENRQLKSKKEKEKFYFDVLVEMKRLNDQGFESKLITESFFDIISGFFGKSGSGILQTIKEYFGNWLIEKLGVDSGGWIGGTIVKAIGNLDMADIPKLTNCNFTTKLLSKSLAENAVSKLQTAAGLEGTLSNIMRNTLVETLEENSTFMVKIEEALGSVLCPLISNVSGKLEDAATAMKEKAIAK